MIPPQPQPQPALKALQSNKKEFPVLSLETRGLRFQVLLCKERTSTASTMCGDLPVIGDWCSDACHNIIIFHTHTPPFIWVVVC